MASTSLNSEQGYGKRLQYQLEVSHRLQEAVVRLRKRPELLTVGYFYYLIFSVNKTSIGLNLPIRNTAVYRSLVIYHRSHSCCRT